MLDHQLDRRSFNLAWVYALLGAATVTVLGLLQKLGWAKLPGGLDVLDNWVIIGVARFIFLVEFVADKVPYVDSVWDAIHTFIRIPAGVIVAYAATYNLDPGIYIPAALLGGGLPAAVGARGWRRRALRTHSEPVPVGGKAT